MNNKYNCQKGYINLEHWKTIHWAVEADEFGNLIKDSHD